MQTIKILIPVNALVDGKSVPLVEGQVLDISETDADNLVRGHYAKYVSDIPAVKIVNKPKGLSNKSMKTRDDHS